MRAFVVIALCTSLLPQESDAADQVGVQAFLEQHCYRCHGVDTQEADFAMHALSTDIAKGEALDRWTEIAERLKAGDMPPVDEPQPDPDAIDKVVAWIDAQLLLAGKSDAIRAGSLQTGNHVDHDLLFNSDIEVPLHAPSRLWRLNNEIYLEVADGATNSALTRAGASRRVTKPFSVPPGGGFRYRASVGMIDESTSAQLIRNAEQLVLEQTRAVVEESPGARSTPREFVPVLKNEPPATEEQIAAAIARQFELCLKRQPTDEEQADYQELHRKNVATGGGGRRHSYDTDGRDAASGVGVSL